MQIIDGKALSTTIKEELAIKTAAIVASGRRVPHLAAVLVGENPASQAYVRNKIKSCEQVGFKSTMIRLDSSTTQEALLEVVDKLNNQADLDGFIVQLPLPDHIDEQAINLAIDYRKDVDGFHPVNFGRMVQGLDAFLPATPMGILEMLKRYSIETSGKHAVVIGRSNIVGKPMSILLGRKANPGNATVTLAHSRTQNLQEVLLQADIIIAAIGIPNFVKADMVKEGAVVIDVGINRVPDASRKSGSRLVGDVDFEAVAPKCSYITPVPGGVGPMTVCSLMMNTLRSYNGEVY
jgi:methylenetetrahydrofolate dehydrogenase (NADP+)/methenyltetrahydrofolate cyclohydrolase